MSLKDNIFTGLVSGIVSPVLAFAVYTKINTPGTPLSTVIQHIRNLGITSTIISISVFINLLVFFIFIWSKADQSARGVLAATFVYAILVVILKLV
jgi:hypothetical protein